MSKPTEEEEAFKEIYKYAIGLFASGMEPSAVVKKLTDDGLDDESAKLLCEHIQQQINQGVEAEQSGRSIAGVFAMQLGLAALGGGLMWLFIGLNSMHGNLVNLSIGGIAVVDSIVATLLLTGAFTCWATALMAFKAYGDVR